MNGASECMLRLKIDPEFESLIPPLAEHEFSLLRHSVVSTGRCDPIHVWNGVIVDGHHRYRICTEYKIEFSVVHHEFADRNLAKEWILLNQLGRRNLGRIQASVLRGNLYKQRRCSLGGKRWRVVDGDRRDTSMELAEEMGVGASTIRSDVQVADAVDRMCEKARSYVLSPDSKARKQNVIDLSHLSHKSQEHVIDVLASGKIVDLRAAIAKLRPVAVKGMHSIRCKRCGAKLAPGVVTCLSCDLTDTDVRTKIADETSDLSLELDRDAASRLTEIRNLKRAFETSENLQIYCEAILEYVNKFGVVKNTKAHKLLGGLWRRLGRALPLSPKAVQAAERRVSQCRRR